MDERGPLAGIRVLEFSQIVAGPLCGALLAELGADVVKIEPPEGDPHRTQSAVVPLESKNFQALNRGKRGLVLDLASERGREVARRMAEHADVVLVNYRPAAASRLGIGYEALRAVNPRLIYWQNTGFGERGPEATRAGADVVAQAYAGLMATTAKVNDRGMPTGSTVPFTDIIAALGGAIGICAALFHRAQGGGGQYVSTSLLRASLWSQIRQVMREPVHDASLRDPMMEAIHRLLDGGAGFQEVVDLRERMNPVLGAGMLYYQTYRARDGFITLGAVTLRTRQRMRELLGIPEEDSDSPDYDAADPETATRALHWRGVIEEKMRARTVAEWIEVLLPAGVPAAPVQFAEEMSDDPQVLADEMVVPLEHAVTGPQRVVAPLVQLSLTPTAVSRAAPALGQHSREVLREYGFEEVEADALLRDGVAHQRG